MSIIKVENLSHVYSEGTPFEKTAIHDINLTIPEGEMVGVIGHTGSGKSTFIQHLNGLLTHIGDHHPGWQRYLRIKTVHPRCAVPRGAGIPVSRVSAL